MTFHIIYKGKHGDTTCHDDPKRAAYNYIYKCATSLGLRHRLICRVDGSYTVEIAGLAPATFEKSQ